VDRQRKLNRPGEKKKPASEAHLFTINPTPSDARFKCRYTVSRQHLTTDIRIKQYSFEMCTQNCMHSALILHCVLTLEPTQNTVKYEG
jgi:hypothetical protein